MNTKTLSNVVDMCNFAASSVDFSQVYEFDNGMKVVVSRNAMVGGHRAGYMAVLPYDKAGNQIDARAEEWLTALDVAQKMQIIASE
jgi:hypothetical protein